ncbi:MAG: hypothetical protein ACI89J_000695 [Hyphomicrobiaceae bacterium]|jgi:hypothetical protein
MMAPVPMWFRRAMWMAVMMFADVLFMVTP